MLKKDRAVEEKIEKLVSELTLEEKIGMIHGNGLFRTREQSGLEFLRLLCQTVQWESAMNLKMHIG